MNLLKLYKTKRFQEIRNGNEKEEYKYNSLVTILESNAYRNNMIHSKTTREHAQDLINMQYNA